MQVATQLHDSGSHYPKASGSNLEFLHIGTANVCTLDPAEFRQLLTIGEEQTARCATLEKAFRDANLHIVGIQEARLPGAHQRQGESYDMYSSGAHANGNHGVELWFRRDSVLTDICPVVVSPRLIWASFRIRSVMWVALSAHAPGENSCPSEKDSFWDSLQKQFDVISVRCTAARVLIFLDANARVGSISDASIGPAEPDIENDNGF
eukprot:5917036-Karenia_brevis.AAC.1